MKGKSGNLIITLKDGDAIDLDGPGTILVKKTKDNRVTILINADNDTTIKRGSKELVENKEIAKD